MTVEQLLNVCYISETISIMGMDTTTDEPTRLYYKGVAGRCPLGKCADHDALGPAEVYVIKPENQSLKIYINEKEA